MPYYYGVLSDGLGQRIFLLFPLSKQQASSLVEGNINLKKYKVIRQIAHL